MRRAQNYTAESFSNGRLGGKKRKRQQDHPSCQVCRDRKVACDRRRPCDNCTALKCPEDCVYDEPGDERVNTTEANEHSSNDMAAAVTKISSIDGRIARLENAVERIAAKVDSRSGAENSNSSKSYATSHPARGHNYAISASNPYADFILDRKKSNDGSFYIGNHNWNKAFSSNMKYFFCSSHLFANQLSSLQALVAHFDPVRRKTLWDFATIPDSTRSHEMNLLALMPDQPVCDVMVARFLATLNSTHPIVDVNSLQNDIDSFWSTKSPRSAPWLAFYLAIVALGYQLPVNLPPDDTYDTNGRKLGKTLMESVLIHGIALAQNSKRPSIFTFQTMLLLILQQKLDLDWVDGFDVTSGLLGSLSRMVGTMGLHRDSEGVGNLDDSEVNVRRQVYWTFLFLDAEHALHCGIPWHYHENDHDVLDPPTADTHWPEYMKKLAGHIPLCSDVIQISHSKRVNVTESRLDELSRRAKQLTTNESAHSSNQGRNAESSTISLIQHALCECLNHHLRILLKRPSLKSEKHSIRKRAEEDVLASCVSIVQFAPQLAKHIRTLPARTREAWTHLVTSLFRCYIFSAGSAILKLLRLSASEDNSDVEERASTLLPKVKAAWQFFEDSLTLSFESIKQLALYWAQFDSVEEGIRADAAEVADTQMLDLDSTPGRLIVLATQQSMERVIQKALIALDEARKSDNPPPNLLASPRKTAEAGQPSAPGVGDVNAPAPMEDGQLSEWLPIFDDWINNSGLLDDVTAAWT